ncbi:hypothetical protein RHSIM_Rhsim09G0071000 [Rhododendron simsii]|uniref:Uncharacterized protein n=1 Tax=Rhododendron simsii TaxID=118357 RepID=A0A834GF31_RHOSS|nr:hypothetical protein RHSIM_Rhsim09G0071000 [Rhododendron simsii]
MRLEGKVLLLLLMSPWVIWRWDIEILFELIVGNKIGSQAINKAVSELEPLEVGSSGAQAVDKQMDAIEVELVSTEAIPAVEGLTELQARGSSTKASPVEGERSDASCTSLAPELPQVRIEEGTTLCIRGEDGVVKLKDRSSGLEVILSPESLFAGVKGEYQSKLISIFERRPDTFMRLGELSSLFAKTILEAFGGLLERLERTELTKASQAEFDELLQILGNLSRGLLRVQWIEDRVRKMAAQARSHCLFSELKVVDQKIIELDGKKKVLEEALEFDRNSQGDFDINGNVAQGLFQ